MAVRPWTRLGISIVGHLSYELLACVAVPLAPMSAYELPRRYSGFPPLLPECPPGGS